MLPRRPSRRSPAALAAGLALLVTCPALLVTCRAAVAAGPPASAGAWQAVEQADLADRIAKAEPLAIEDVCTPIRSVRRGELLWAPNPDGRTWDLLQIYFPHYGGPHTLVAIDLAAGTVKPIQTEAGLNFHLCPRVVVPDGRLFISVLEGMRQQICIYRPDANALDLKALAMPEALRGETHPLVLGTDGMLYAIGAHPSRSAAAARIDPATGKVAFFAPIGPSHAPNGCWGYSGAADDRYIYIASGKVPWYLVAYDRRTGTSAVLAETEPVGGYVGVSQGRFGCTAHASHVKGTDGKRIDYWLHEGKALPKKDRQAKPPWPVPAEVKPRVPSPPRPEVSVARAVPDPEGRAEIRVRPPGEKQDADARQDATDRVFRYTVPVYPQPVHRVTELPDGRLFGTAGAYEGMFLFDPKTGTCRHPGKIGLSHYATAVAGGRIYMSGYPSSPLYVYDPDRPWTAGAVGPDGRVVRDEDTGANPRLLFRMNTWAGTHKMYAAGVGADGSVWFGGRWIRNGAAGGLAWFDPDTGKADGFWKPLSNHQVCFMTTARGGRTLVLSTLRRDDPLLGKPKPAEGKLILVDTASKQIVGDVIPVPGVRGPGPVVGVGGGRVIGWTNDPEDAKRSVLYGVDVAERKVFWRKTLPHALPVQIGSNQKEPFDFRLGPDGRVWTFIAGRLVRIDPADASIAVLGRVDRGGRLAFAGGDVYLAGTTALRRIREIGK